jgi:hypothetical protein
MLQPSIFHQLKFRLLQLAIVKCRECTLLLLCHLQLALLPWAAWHTGLLGQACQFWSELPPSAHLDWVIMLQGRQGPQVLLSTAMTAQRLVQPLT